MPRITTFVPRETLATLTNAWLASLVDRSHIRATADGGIFGSAIWGGAQIVGALISLERPGSSALVKVLDSTRDWRDRLIIVGTSYRSSVIGGETVYPGANSLDKEFGSIQWKFGYTGTGVAQATVALNSYHIALSSLRIYARDTNGALQVDLPNTAAHAMVSAIIRVISSDQLGIHSTPTAFPGYIASAGANIIPRDLNLVQDPATLHQAGTGTLGGVTLPSDSMPFGAQLRGGPSGPPVPEIWTVRGSERRQNAIGAVRRFFSASVANNTHIKLDDSVDWRDRFLIAQGRYYSANDIRPGETNDTLINNTATKFEECDYLGAGQVPGAQTSPFYGVQLNVADTLVLFAGDTDGALYVRNNTGSTQYVVAMVEGSFQLGPRTPR